MEREANQEHYTFDSTVNEEREDYITKGLVAFNLAHSKAYTDEQYSPQPLHLYVLNSAGTVLGGLVGRTHSIPFWLEVSIIWVDEQVRHQGLGRQLMGRAEHEARSRGCRYARLATSDYQAPEFYQGLGYKLYGKLENCPPGETVFYFWKELVTS